MPQVKLPTTCLSEGTDAYFWHATETPEELLSLLPPEKNYRETAATFGSASRQREWLAVRVLLHRALGPQADMRYHSTRRPYLADSDVCISVSHSHGHIAISLSHKPHGMDIEVYGPRALRLSQGFLNPSEQPLTAGDERRAVMLWSAKESVYKRYDIPGLSFAEGIIFSEAPHGLNASLPQHGLQCRLRYDFLPNFVLTCTEDL